MVVSDGYGVARGGWKVRVVMVKDGDDDEDDGGDDDDEDDDDDITIITVLLCAAPHLPQRPSLQQTRFRRRHYEVVRLVFVVNDVLEFDAQLAVHCLEEFRVELVRDAADLLCSLLVFSAVIDEVDCQSDCKSSCKWGIRNGGENREIDAFPTHNHYKEGERK